MGIIKHTTLGIPHGKIGNLVFYPLNGKTVCRQAGDPGPQSPLQLANCQKMSVTMKLLKPMIKFINLGFGLQTKGTDKNPHNLATAYHKKHALKGIYPNIRVDYAKVVLSQGELSQISGVQVSLSEKGLQFNWDSGQKSKDGRYDDQVMIMVCYPATKKADQHLNAAKRSDGSHFIALHPEDLQGPIALYMSLRSADGTSISDSMYLGILNEKEEVPEMTPEENELDKAEKKISDLKFRFAQVSNSYLKQLEEINKGESLENADFHQLEAEYLTLKSKIRQLTKEPVSKPYL